MILNNKKINEGIALSAIKTDKFKSSVISFSLIFPMSKDAVAYNTLLSHLLLRGTASYPSISLLNKRLDELYGSYVEVKSHNVGRNVSLSISAEVLESKYITDGTDVIGEVIAIISELILSPAFLQKDFNRFFFEQEKKLLLDSINSEINNTRVYATKRCVEAMYEGTEKPTSEELKSIVFDASFERLISHYQTFILNTPINIFYIGADSDEAIANKISSAFANHSPYAKFELSSPQPTKPPRHVEKKLQMPISQGKLSLGFSTKTVIRAEDDSYYAMILLNEIFGGSPLSKLFCNVREKLSLCYYCSSSYSLYSGIMLVSSGFEMKNYEIAKEAILAQLEDIRSGNVSDAEFIAAQKSVINAYRQLYDSPMDMQAFFGDRALFGINDTLDTAQEKLLAVTKDEVISVAKRITLEASFFIEGVGDCEEEDEND